jgi:hypothetical protein
MMIHTYIHTYIQAENKLLASEWTLILGEDCPAASLFLVRWKSTDMATHRNLTSNGQKSERNLTSNGQTSERNLTSRDTCEVDADTCEERDEDKDVENDREGMVGEDELKK